MNIQFEIRKPFTQPLALVILLIPIIESRIYISLLKMKMWGRGSAALLLDETRTH
jgi:hypothetical protein